MKPFSIMVWSPIGSQEWCALMVVGDEQFLRSCNDKFRTVKWTKIDWKEIQNYGNGTKKTSGIQERAEKHCS